MHSAIFPRVCFLRNLRSIRCGLKLLISLRGFFAQLSLGMHHWKHVNILFINVSIINYVPFVHSLVYVNDSLETLGASGKPST